MKYMQTKKNKMGHLLKFAGDMEGDFTI
jgi:hypothetical protein